MTARSGGDANVHVEAPPIAIMQGRLSAPINGQLQAFPADTWESEFARAADAGLDAIEWIFESPTNPVLSSGSVARIRQLTDQTRVAVRSICADYFMDAPLHRGTDADVLRRVDVLRALVDRASELGARHIVLPCVDQSAITDHSDRDRLVAVLADVISYLDARDVELHLETSLPPDDFASLLGRVPSSVRANYDSGNSSSLGYDVSEEFAAYGERVGSVHIKDRIRGGGSVPLGTGDANFAALFDALDRVRYRALFTLQVTRGEPGDEVQLARKNRAFVLDQVNAAAARS